MFILNYFNNLLQSIILIKGLFIQYVSSTHHYIFFSFCFWNPFYLFDFNDIYKVFSLTYAWYLFNFPSYMRITNLFIYFFYTYIYFYHANYKPKLMKSKMFIGKLLKTYQSNQDGRKALLFEKIQFRPKKKNLSNGLLNW